MLPLSSPIWSWSPKPLNSLEPILSHFERLCVYAGAIVLVKKKEKESESKRERIRSWFSALVSFCPYEAPVLPLPAATLHSVCKAVIPAR